MFDKPRVEKDDDGTVLVYDDEGEIVLAMDQIAAKNLGLDCLAMVGYEPAMANRELKGGIRTLLERLSPSGDAA